MALLDTERAFREARRAAAIGAGVAGGIDLITKTILKHLENKRLSAETRQKWRQQLELLGLKHGFSMERLRTELESEERIAGMKAAERRRLGVGRVRENIGKLLNPVEWTRENRKKGGRLVDPNTGTLNTELIDPKTGNLTGDGKKLWLDDVTTYLDYDRGLLENEQVFNAVNTAIDTVFSKANTDLLSSLIAAPDPSNLFKLASFVGRGQEITSTFNEAKSRVQTADIQKRIGERIIGKKPEKQREALIDEMARHFAINTLTQTIDPDREAALEKAIQTTGLNREQILGEAIIKARAKLPKIGRELNIPVRVERPRITPAAPGVIPPPTGERIFIQREVPQKGFFGERQFTQEEEVPTAEELREAIMQRRIGTAGFGLGAFELRRR